MITHDKLVDMEFDLEARKSNLLRYVSTTLDALVQLVSHKADHGSIEEFGSRIHKVLFELTCMVEEQFKTMSEIGSYNAPKLERKDVSQIIILLEKQQHNLLELIGDTKKLKDDQQLVVYNDMHAALKALFREIDDTIMLLADIKKNATYPKK